jgi:TctA family transporter
MLFTLIITASIQETNLLKNFIMIAFGILLGMVGIDVNTGVNRFTFGFLNLSDGINIIILISGLFGIGEILYSVKQKRDGYLLKINKLIPSLEDIKKSIMPCLRGSSIGAFFGALPGTGPTISSFVSYITEKKISKNPEQFGKGKIEGVVSPEAANNSAVQTALIPTLSMGVPGDPIMVIILSVFMMKGIVPGPSFIHDNNQLFWILSSSFVIGNFICLILNISLLKVWIKITSIPYDFIFGSVIILSILGAYTLNNNVFDVIMIGVFGILGYLLKFYKFDLVCLVLGFCLGPSIEIFLRRGLVMYNENYYNFLTSSNISLCFLLLSFLTLLFSIYKRYSKNI